MPKPLLLGLKCMKLTLSYCVHICLLVFEFELFFIGNTRRDPPAFYHLQDTMTEEERQKRFENATENSGYHLFRLGEIFKIIFYPFCGVQGALVCFNFLLLLTCFSYVLVDFCERFSYLTCCINFAVDVFYLICIAFTL